jgi:hypothetical protein
MWDSFNLETFEAQGIDGLPDGLPRHISDPA